MDIRNYLEVKRQEVDRYLHRYFERSCHAPRLVEAVRYSLLAGGKRIRPILTIAAAEAVGGKSVGEVALPPGCAIEMIHTYSLIHDDLPAMDNDDLRRGRPTNHKAYGESLAILAGDSLLTEAFVILSSQGVVNPATLLSIIREVSTAAGGEGMAGGQALDLLAAGRKISQEELEKLHRLKTGCLIQAAVVSGALLGGASFLELESLRGYGAAVGLAFQIADDILDVEGGREELGKPVHSDATKAKATYPSILGLEKSKKLAHEWTEQAIAAIEGFDSKADPLREIARFIVSRRS